VWREGCEDDAVDVFDMEDLEAAERNLK